MKRHHTRTHVREHINLKLKVFLVNLLVWANNYAQQLYQQYYVFPVLLFYISLANYITDYMLCFSKHVWRGLHLVKDMQ